MNDIILLIGGLYIFTGLFIWVGLKMKKELSEKNLPAGCSLVICARNEEGDLPLCLESVENQSIKSDEMEVVLVDDASADRTGELMEEYSQRSRYSVKVLHLPKVKPGEISGKWRPLKEGLKLAARDHLLMTDADAVLPPNWATNHLRALQDYPIAAGFVVINRRGIWGNIQCLDWLFISGVGCSLSNWNSPQAAFGKNLSVRRGDYLETGGYETIGFSLTEDQALVSAVTKRGKELNFLLNHDICVKSPGVESLKEFIHQRKRWGTGIKSLTPLGKICFIAAALRHFTIIAGILSGISAAFGIWIASSLLNLLILAHIGKKLRVSNCLWAFPLWEIFSTWSAPVQLYTFLTSRGVRWKGRDL